ncbi:MAG: transcriptional regulator, TetR family [Devosia sp.]|uniref:TetR/AcrR family transcriptional regulator n=1 Tax=Devosia sp. TaxID=1871048 RepID=UPI0026238E81|nr:TetR/AcrR family transcriptional regulator [Devosia sp.]MDB5527293.1 transcriptional regulator, TetR family [Devosia sp.]
MARPRNEDKRNGILAAATALIAEQGLGAATSEIAKKAGVPHGSVFTYFETKAELLNVLYLELTTELTDTVTAVMSIEDDTRAQFHRLWTGWTQWGVINPSKRRVQAQLNVSDQVSEQSRKSAYDYAEPVFELIRRASARGALRNAPIDFVGALVEALVVATTDSIIRDPERADEYSEAGFEAAWQALS